MKRKENQPPRHYEETDRICRTLASEYNHRSSVLCEDMIQELEKRGVSRATLLTNSKVRSDCVLVWIQRTTSS